MSTPLNIKFVDSTPYLSFFGATPVAQPAHIASASTIANVALTGLSTVSSSSTIGDADSELEIVTLTNAHARQINYLITYLGTINSQLTTQINSLAAKINALEVVLESIGLTKTS